MDRYIIFADYDADDLELITSYFRKFDPSVKVVELKDGKEVIHFLEVYAKHSSKPLLVVLDMNMPRMNGKETVIAIRKHPMLSDIPILIYSTSNNKSEAAFCKELLVTWVTKPATVDAVKEVAKVLAEFCKTQH